MRRCAHASAPSDRRIDACTPIVPASHHGVSLRRTQERERQHGRPRADARARGAAQLPCALASLARLPPRHLRCAACAR
eukprot:279290-Pleurochrysis_carterae.AAC.2